MKSQTRAKVPPLFEELDDAAQHQVCTRVMQQIRTALRRNPHSILELHQQLAREDAGALTAALNEMLQAGEIAPLGHGVYARVPWMPAMRPVQATPIQDLVFAALAHCNHPPTIATRLGMPIDRVKQTLSELEHAGLAEPYIGPSRRGRYYIASPLLAKHLRRGATGRVFADVSNVAEASNNA